MRKFGIIFLFLSPIYKIDAMKIIRNIADQKCLLVARYLYHYPDGRNDEEKQKIETFFDQNTALSIGISEYKTILKILPEMNDIIPDVKNKIYSYYLYPETRKYFAEYEAKQIIRKIQQGFSKETTYHLCEGCVKKRLLCKDILHFMNDGEMLSNLNKYNKYNSHENDSTFSFEILFNGGLYYLNEQLDKKIQKFKNCMTQLKLASKNLIEDMESLEKILNALDRGLEEKTIMVPLLCILGEDLKNLDFVEELIQNNKQNNDLIVFTPQRLRQWQKLHPDTRLELGALEVDIKNEPEIFTDKMIRHAPILAATFLPDIVWYYLDHITHFSDMSPLLIKPFCFCASIYASNLIGYYGFPVLDATFHSHVKLLRTFFGDHVRARISRGMSFTIFSFMQSALAYTANCFLLTQTIPGITVAVALYFLRAILYKIMNESLWYKNPIDRGAPYTGSHVLDENRDDVSVPYALKHLKVS